MDAHRKQDLILKRREMVRNIREMQDQSLLLWYRAREIVRRIQGAEWDLEHSPQPDDSLRASITDYRAKLDGAFKVIRASDDAVDRCRERIREIDKELRPSLPQRATAALLEWFWPAIIIQAILSGKSRERLTGTKQPITNRGNH